MSKETVILRCLVKKPAGQDSSCATKAGFAVNIYCADGYMWISLPNVSVEQMEKAIEHAGFEKASEVEYEMDSRNSTVKRCLVKKPAGKDISCATRQGFAVNLHCAEGYMWVSLPNVSFEQMERVVRHSMFEKVSEIEAS